MSAIFGVVRFDAETPDRDAADRRILPGRGDRRRRLRPCMLVGREADSGHHAAERDDPQRRLGDPE